MNAFLVCGVAGPGLDEDERRLLEEVRPAGIILFGRNVVERGQLGELVGELSGLPSAPYIAIDLEGGRVNRLERLTGPLPSALDAARRGRPGVRALAEAAGAACAHLGIGVDLAPVADVALKDGFLASEARCLGSSPGEVQAAAATFLGGLAAFGVSGCLKHYPGLGSGRLDSHVDLPVLGEGVRAEREVFHALARTGCAVMVAHALAPALGDDRRPATLSPEIVAPLRPLAAPILADDLEMGALAGFGPMAKRAQAALAAGCDQVLVCNALGARREVAEHVRSTAGREPGFASALTEARRRLGRFGHEELRKTEWDEVLRLADRARRLAGGGR